MGAQRAAESGADLRRNAALIVLNGVAFGLVDTLVKPNLVLVVFLARLTDNPIILGMPLALWTGGFLLSQLAVTGYVQRATRAQPIYKVTSVIRMVLWLMLIVITLFAERPEWLVAGLVIFLIGYPLTWGVAGLVFFEVVSKVIPPRLRGPIFSWRLIGSGLLALVGSWLVNRLLEAESVLGFPGNFALIFAIAACVTTVGLLSFHAVREPESASIPIQAGLRGGWREIRAVWQTDRLFRHYVLARVALQLAAGTSPFIIVFAQERFGLPLATAGRFLVVDTVVGLLAVAVSGWISARLGNRLLVMLAAVTGLGTFALVTWAAFAGLPEDAVFGYFLVIFTLLAASNAASNVGFVALNLNIPPEQKRPLYIGLSNTIFGVASYASIGQGALVVLAGYQGLFGLAALLAAVGAWQIIRHLYDPAESRDHATA
ncbi:MAG: hypothetical protein Kow0077_30260 [Anaerolineae bacterium]